MSNDGLYLVDVRTGATNLIRPGARFWYDVAWSHDGSQIAGASNGVIAVVRHDGSALRVVHTGTQGYDHGPSWSAAGRRIAYGTDLPGSYDRKSGGSIIYTIGLDGSDRRLLAQAGGWPAWSPNGRTIAYLASCGVRLVAPDGTPLSGCLGVHGAPVWSPDGRRIAMALTTAAQGRAKGIYTMNADGSRLTRVSHTVPTTLTPDDAPPRPVWLPLP